MLGNTQCKIQIVLSILLIIVVDISASAGEPSDSLILENYRTGEKLKYVMSYGIFDGAEATLTLKETSLDKKVLKSRS